jgi:N6-L-threonylcarbamoyladenine synthase
LGGYPIVVVGGVARNNRLRELLTPRAEAVGLPVRFPDPSLCTDNAAMVAAAGHFQYEAGERSSWDLDVRPGLRLR